LSSHYSSLFCWYIYQGYHILNNKTPNSPQPLHMFQRRSVSTGRHVRERPGVVPQWTFPGLHRPLAWRTSRNVTTTPARKTASALTTSLSLSASVCLVSTRLLYKTSKLLNADNAFHEKHVHLFNANYEIKTTHGEAII